MNTILNYRQEIQNYIDTLVENELSYEKDFITNDGWNIIENIVPVHTLKYIMENEDLSALSQDDIRLVFEQMLEKYSSASGLRQFD